MHADANRGSIRAGRGAGIERRGHDPNSELRPSGPEGEAAPQDGSIASTFAQRGSQADGDTSSVIADRKRLLDEALDRALDQSFPASDPVALFVYD